MKIIIAGATGFVGRHLVPILLQRGDEVTVISREVDKITKIFNGSVKALSWGELNHVDPKTYQAVINLAGENIADHRWSDRVKAEIIKSRVATTQKLSHWCLPGKDNLHLYNASAVGIYGSQAFESHFPEPLTEASALPSPAKDFLSEVGKQWEQALNAAAASGMPVTMMRFGVVLKRKEGMLKKLEWPARLGMSMILGSGKQPLSWIDIDDLVNAIIFLIEHPEITGAVNLCSPQSITQEKFTRELATAVHRSVFLTMPTSVVKFLFGQMGEELLLSGQNVYPERLLDEGFEFTYPDIKSALRKEFSN